ncbi:Protein of unknown function DUF2346 [Kalmanozyma brasiliensis GHG001]|uniref:Mitochondrial cytochrome c oxidase assembly factor n=1 Tax=Kalmanozyma brasiliensis (strain GHG001) TaxID=1365824 RepID=V5EP44_KALBG|nr:Protein of unknown function DUF2346 [Kalmanozyma brasiliensis GHG001]EST04698.1 Protein of unknown function DUF2346 [Kalmanozyma brasiliensis GHG001]
MAGPNLELFKFGLYLFFPLAVMVHYGDPDFYARNVAPIRDQFWPKEESLYRPPRNSADVRTALDEMKAKRLAKREARLQEQGESLSLPSSSQPKAEQPRSQIASLVEDKRSQRLV